MASGFSAFNPLVWSLFGAFVVLVYGIERVFRARNPEYPSGRRPDGSRKEGEAEASATNRPAIE